jgi:dihydrofolate reductase
MTRNGVIGHRGRLPWDLPADRQLFRRLTEGNTILMGRLTFESLAAPLPNRHNIVVSRSIGLIPGATVCRSFLEGLALGWQLGRPVYVIGGVELYRKALAVADNLYVSWVMEEFPGDRRFPTFDPADWLPVSATDYPGFRHAVYRRTDPPV